MAYLTIALVGLLGGLLSGLFGVGGGLVFVPLLMLLRHYDTHLAVGTSLAVIVPTACMAVVKHGGAGMIDWKAAFWIALFAMMGAWLGSGISLGLDTAILRRLFAVFLMFVAFKIFFLN